MEHKELQKYLLHRYPFVMLDRILELDAGKYAKGLKNVSSNEWFFQGHFPGNPILPGVLIIEALAQLAAVAQTCRGDGPSGAPKPQLGYLAGVRDFKFLKPVVPGDQLILTVQFLRQFGRIFMVQGSARVGEAQAAAGKLLFAVMEDE